MDLQRLQALLAGVLQHELELFQGEPGRAELESLQGVPRRWPPAGGARRRRRS
ncbi:hypothetical protein [Metapseudomonas otitidis]|uniref:hypothetical protein n=1 Tax=Metapseudomonas otitidis TaxID=319939 RepID=UPI0013DEBFA9|nr:hypothetical protein [Pseudomonas otitidis]